ncbi:hypothetical protein ACLKA6_007569 [Drosophila palustris]
MPADTTKIATPEMVTMPTGQAKGAGPRKPVFHPGLGVEGVILPPPITSELRQSAKSAAVSPAGARTVGEAPTAGTRKKFSFTERRSAGDILQRNHNNAGPNLSADWLRKVEWARSVIPDWKPSSKALAQAKRQRSQDTPAPSAKKSRVQPGRSFAQIARERILIGVLDRGNLEGGIPRNQWRRSPQPVDDPAREARRTPPPADLNGNTGRRTPPRATQAFHDQPRPSPYTTASRSTSSIAVHNSFTINLVHRRTQQLHDQPRPSPYTTASRSTSSITIHNGFTIVLV